MLVKTYGIGFAGLEAHVVSVQLHRTRGARFHVSGVPWSEVRKSLARIFAAFETGGFARPSGALTVHVTPVDACKQIQVLDVPLALSLLAASGTLPLHAVTNRLFAGELGLDGLVQPLNHTWLHLHTSDSDPLQHCIAGYLPGGNAAHGYRALKPLPLRRIDRLDRLVAHLQTGEELPVFKFHNPWNRRVRWKLPSAAVFDSLELSKSQWMTLAVAAAGRLSLLLIGSPGTGKSQMARAVWELLPRLSENQSSELHALHLSRGIPYEPTEAPPWRSPHHRSSASGLTGTHRDVKGWRAGELSLASHGVLCLDELNEFSRDCIESLRGPMENGNIDIVRAEGSARYPVDALIIGTANPCPCGHLHEGAQACACTPHEIKRHMTRISGPVADRFALHLETTHSNETDPGRPDLMPLRTCVERVRGQLDALPTFHWHDDAEALLRLHAQKWRTSFRGVAHLRRIAAVHAAVQIALTHPNSHHSPAAPVVTAADVEFAGQMRIFDRPRWWEIQPVANYQPGELP